MPTRAKLVNIHIAKRYLKLTNQLYCGVLNVFFRETSAWDLSLEQIDEQFDNFKSLGVGNEDTKKVTTLSAHTMVAKSRLWRKSV